MKEKHYIEQTKAWIEQIVIAYNLCPFAKHPFQNNQIRYVVSQATSEEALLEQIVEELMVLKESVAKEIETTLIIHPDILQSFSDYNAFAHTTANFLEQTQLDKEFQIAEFHPQYQFAGTEPDDAENYTNRAPYPMQHLLREESVDRAINSHLDIHSVPIQNVKTMEALGREKILEILEGIRKRK